jgi:hypothetical protein
MARIPSRVDLGATPLPTPTSSGAFARASSATFGGDGGLIDAGNGVAAVGGAINQAAELARRDEEKRQREIERSEDFETEVEFQRLLSAQALELDEAAESIEPGGIGFAESRVASFDSAASGFLDRVPERVKGQYQARIEARKGTFAGQADNFEDKERLRNNGSILTSRLDELMADVARDPDNSKAFVDAGIRTIDASPIPETAKADLKRTWRQQTAERREVARVSGDVEYAKVFKDPQRRAVVGKAVAGAKSIGMDPAVALAILDRESGLNPSAKNPNSTAHGVGQFIDGTWESEGGGDRNDADEQLRVFFKHTEKNTRELERALGEKPSPAEIYAAHFLGLGGAKRAFSQPDNTPMKDIFGKSWAGMRKANGLRDDITVGEFEQSVARDLERRAKKFGGIVSRGVGTVSGIDAGGIDAAGRTASSVLSEHQKAIDDAAKASIKAENDAIELERQRVLMEVELASKDGQDVEPLVRQLIDDQVIKPNQAEPIIARSRENVRKTEKAEIERQERQELLNGHLTGSSPLQPNNKDHRNLISDAFNDAVPSGAPIFGDDGTPARDRAVAMSASFGIAPDAATKAIRGAVLQRDPDRMLEAIQLARVISGNSPGAFAGQDGAGEIDNAVSSFNHFTDSLRYTPEEAVQEIIRRTDEGQKLSRSARTELAKTTLEDFDVDDFEGRFGGMFSNPDLGGSPGTRDVLFARYQERLKSEILNVGDVEIATARTDAAFISTPESPSGYGVTSVGGDDYVLENPPENFNPTFPGGIDGMTKQLHDDVVSHISKMEKTSDVEIGHIGLANVPGNNARIARGLQPQYTVWFEGKVNGEPFQTMLPDDGYVFDPVIAAASKAIDEVDEFVEGSTRVRVLPDMSEDVSEPTTDEIFDEISGTREDRESMEKLRSQRQDTKERRKNFENNLDFFVR